MSADNGIYILRTYTQYVKEDNGVRYVKDRFPVWRVAHTQAIDNFDNYKRDQPENIGAYMKDVWGFSSVHLTAEDAMEHAQNISDKMKDAERTLEYGIVSIDTDYTFYQD